MKRCIRIDRIGNICIQQNNMFVSHFPATQFKRNASHTQCIKNFSRDRATIRFIIGVRSW